AVGADGWGGPDGHASVVVEDDAAGATVERIHVADGAARIHHAVDVKRGRVVDRAGDGIAPLDGTIGAVEGVQPAFVRAEIQQAGIVAERGSRPDASDLA